MCLFVKSTKCERLFLVEVCKAFLFVFCCCSCCFTSLENYFGFRTTNVNEINVVKVRFIMRYSSRKLSNDKVITIACNFWRQIAWSFQVMSENTLFLGNKIFEIPPFFQTRPGDLGKKVHACSLRFSALNFQAFWVKPSPTLGLVYQVKKADWYPFVPFVCTQCIQFASLFFLSVQVKHLNKVSSPQDFALFRCSS